MVEWGQGDVIPRMCVRSTLLEVRKLLCATRTFLKGIFCLVGLSGFYTVEANLIADHANA